VQADYSHILRSLAKAHAEYIVIRVGVSAVHWFSYQDIDHQAAMSKRGFDGLSLIAKEQMCDREIDEGLI